MNLELSFGALTDSLDEQLRGCGLVVLEPEKLAHLQRDADALSRLAIRSVLTDSAVAVARRKILKQICALKMTHSTPEVVK